ncbi:Filamentous Growth Regulator [Polyrhizophydium stewartii]|uniref:Filamentous Growth Regulator n=1 Tax=Polyrhizophydium stewartii TaxID=2732419 RepID=A0ABR4N771_9FUNG
MTTADTHPQSGPVVLLAEKQHADTTAAASTSGEATPRAVEAASSVAPSANDDDDDDGKQDPFYRLAEVISDIGMGPYQWKMFWLCGMGWVADNMWLQGIATALPQFQKEFNVPDSIVGLGTSATFIGMIFGALGWGIVSDAIGRTHAFNLTLLITAIFGTLLTFTPSFPVLCVGYALMALGVGGNLPVDGSLFLEFTPKQNQNLLSLLSVFWPVGQILVGILSWLLIPRFSCPDADHCDTGSNRGWRYLMFSMGMLTFAMVIGRVVLFRMLESPKFLLAAGRYDEALAVVKEVARQNNKKIDITIDDIVPDKDKLAESNKRFSPRDVLPLFSRKMIRTTLLVWAIWMLVAVGYTMFNGFLAKFLKLHGGGEQLSDDETYRNYLIISFFGVPGSLIAMYAVDTRIGRIGTMALSTLGTAVTLGLFTVFTSSTGQLIVSCVEGVLQNAMYGVIYSYTPEVFRTKYRGTAVGMASALGRVTGAVAPIITGVLLESSVNTPLYVSATLIGLSFVCMVLLPIETRGRHAL